MLEDLDSQKGVVYESTTHKAHQEDPTNVRYQNQHHPPSILQLNQGHILFILLKSLRKAMSGSLSQMDCPQKDCESRLS